MTPSDLTRIYFDLKYCCINMIPQGLTIRDAVTTRGGYLGFRLDRAAHTMREEAEQSQVVDLLLGLIQ